MRVVGALAVLVLRARHQEVAAAGTGHRLHADLERDRVDVCDAEVAEDQGAADGPAQPPESPARPDEPLEVVQVVLLGQKAHAPTERDVGRAGLLQANIAPPWNIVLGRSVAPTSFFSFGFIPRPGPNFW